MTQRKDGFEHPPVNVMPEYSKIARGNRDLFLAFRNAVIVYCEDEGWEEFYARLIQRLSIDHPVEDVFCLGGKGELKRRLSEKSSKPRIFFYDKDFDDLTGRVETDEKVVYLGRYAIENYFVDEDLFLKFVLDHKKGARRGRVQGKLDFEARLATFIGWYRDLCRYFVLSEKFKLGVQGPKLAIKEFCLADGGLDQSRFTRFKEEFLEAVRKKQAWLLEEDRLSEELKKAFVPVPKWSEMNDGTDLCHLPGKHLFEYFVTVLVAEFDIEERCRYNFLMTSAERVNTSLFEIVEERVRNALHAQGLAA